MPVLGKELDQSSQKRRRNAAIVSLLVSVSLLGVKMWGYVLTGSQAVFSDAVESIVNVIAAALALVVVTYANRPADQDHPYGHGKAEFFSSAFEGGLITFASLFIFEESVRALLQGHQPIHLDLGVVVVLGAGLCNFLLGFFLSKRGKEDSSVALKASAQHVFADVWTSVAVGLGLAVAVFTGFYWIDGVLGFGIGIVLARSGIKLIRESVSALMDQEDLTVLGDLAEVFKKYAYGGIIQIHHVKVIRSGSYHHIDAHIVVPEFWTVSELHGHVREFERSVIESYTYGGEMNFHFDPCRRAYCEACDYEPCPIRRVPMVERMPVRLDDIRAPDEPAHFKNRP